MTLNLLQKKIFIAALALTFNTLFSATTIAAERKPNIIYILADDLGYGELGCYGQRKIKTPHLDKIASEGMKFTQHYSGASICAPSRYTLITGKHIGRSQTTSQQQKLKKDEFTLHKLCKQAGYTTAAIGKWGLGNDPNDQGIDEWYGFLDQGYAHFFYPEKIWKNRKQLEIPQNAQKEGLRIDNKYTDKIKNGVYIHDEFTKEALSFIKNNKDNPFFLYLPYTIPHLELVVPDDSLAQYKGKFEERPFVAKIHSPEGRQNRPVGGTKFYEGLGYCDQDQPRATYAAMISRMDRDIGIIMQTLKDLKIDEHTLVIFSSDNGPAWFETGGCDREFFQSAGKLRDGKASYYEGGIRVPMIARWPGKIAAGSVTDHVSYFPDVLPTLAELLDLEITSQTDGISMLPTLLQQGEQKQHNHLVWSRAIRMGKWKYVNRELYDLENDPEESKNIARQHPEIAQKMKHILEESFKQQKAAAKKGKLKKALKTH